MEALLYPPIAFVYEQMPDPKFVVAIGSCATSGGAFQGCYNVVGHFCEEDAVTTLRVKLPRHGGAVPSISDLYANALFFERELHEMFGVTVNGLADTSYLFLPDGWPEGVYPLLKDVDPYAAAQKVTGGEEPEMGRKGDKFIVPVGPQHPALKEPGHFEFSVDGELVTGASARLGYVHRGIERACQQQNYVQNLYLVERVCGICSHSHATAYTNGVEKLAKVEAPPRAQAIREVIACLERIHSHLLWLGVASHEAGFETLFMYSWRDREVTMDLPESITGNRVNYSANVLGGVKFDISPAQADAIRRGLDKTEERARHYLNVVTTDSSFLARAQGIGVTSTAEAETLGILGPTARAAGVARDVRVNAPYGGYKQFPVKIVVDQAGDLAARFKVRVEEIFESSAVIRTILDHMPEGELSVKFPRRIPPGEAISRFEAPRGELFYYIKSNGSDTPERVKIRTPSICNWIYVLKKAVGAQLADVPPLLASIDPCFSCNDRMPDRAGPDLRVSGPQADRSLPEPDRAALVPDGGGHREAPDQGGDHAGHRPSHPLRGAAGRGHERGPHGGPVRPLARLPVGLRLQGGPDRHAVPAQPDHHVYRGGGLEQHQPLHHGGGHAGVHPALLLRGPLHAGPAGAGGGGGELADRRDRGGGAHGVHLTTESGAAVALLGIQPQQIDFGTRLSDPVRRAVRRVVDGLSALLLLP